MSRRSQQHQLTKADIISGLDELVRRAAGDSLTAEIYVFGGGALAIANLRESTTVDVDSWINAKKPVVDKILAIGAAIGNERGWERDWLNCEVAQFIPDEGEPFDWIPHAEVGSIRILLAPFDMLLAMKLRSNRPRDLGDVAGLVERCGVTTVQQALQIFERYFSHDGPSDRARDWMVDNLQDRPPQPPVPWTALVRDPADVYIDTYITEDGDLVDGHWTSEE